MQSIYYGTAETAASRYHAPRGLMITTLKLPNTTPRRRRRLQTLGLSNLTLKLWVPTSSQAWNPSPLKTAELIQADMAQVGVKVIIIPVEGRFRRRD